MPSELLNLLIQLPVVAVFVWYSERINQQFQKFLKEQREADRGVLQNLVQKVEKLGDLQEDHDKRMSEAVTTMKERTAARTGARGKS